MYQEYKYRCHYLQFSFLLLLLLPIITGRYGTIHHQPQQAEVNNDNATAKDQRTETEQFGKVQRTAQEATLITAATGTDPLQQHDETLKDESIRIKMEVSRMNVKQNVPETITDTYQQIHLNINIMYVNKVSYMTAICIHIKMMNYIIMIGQDKHQMLDTVEMITQQYSQSGSRERIKCVGFNIPFTKLPRDFLIEAVLQIVTLMNSLPRKDEMHPTLSSRDIVKDKKFYVPRHEIGGNMWAQAPIPRSLDLSNINVTQTNINFL